MLNAKNPRKSVLVNLFCTIRGKYQKCLYKMHTLTKTSCFLKIKNFGYMLISVLLDLSKELHILVNPYSKGSKVKPHKFVTTGTIISNLHQVFATHTAPKMIMSRNFTHFSSARFDDFAIVLMSPIFTLNRFQSYGRTTC